LTTPSPNRRETRLRTDPAGDGADQVVAHRHGAGGHQVGQDRARQPPRAQRAGAPAIDLGDAADHAQVGGERRDDIGEGQRHQRGDRRHLPRGGLDLARASASSGAMSRASASAKRLSASKTSSRRRDISSRPRRRLARSR
jgi:hypothetical protein